jgi:hypothetical protein
MKMAFALNYLFDDGKEQRCIATIYHDGQNIRYKLHFGVDGIACPELRRRDIRKDLIGLISLPIVRQQLRAKTLPDFFNEEIQPNSLEHFQSIPHDFGSFRFSQIKECDNIPYQETHVA